MNLTCRWEIGFGCLDGDGGARARERAARWDGSGIGRAMGGW